MCILAGNFLSAQEGFPTSPKPGACYVSCITADEYKTVEQRIMTKPEFTKLEVVPGRMKTVEETVLVKEASKRMVYVPAVYETVEVTYESRQASNTLNVNPATFVPATEVIETYPASYGWEYSTIANCKSNNPGDCRVLCYVEKPAASRTVGLQKLASDASSSSTPVPAKSSTYKKQVIKTPARMEEVEIPAEYTKIKKEMVEVAPSTRTVTVPAEYTTINKTELVKKGGITKYEEIDCKLARQYNALPIFYASGSAALSREAKATIDETLYTLMIAKPNANIEIASHTDSRSDSGYNMSLSQRRAEAVVNYLVNKGIKRSRLVAKGNGESQLKNRCADGVDCTDAEHQQNRRTEFRVMNAE